jgi:hypothetical protein
MPGPSAFLRLNTPYNGTTPREGPVMQRLDAIYLFKPSKTENYTDTWTYYRVRGGPNDGDAVEVFRVKFPSFEDKEDQPGTPGAIQTPGVVGYNGVPSKMEELLKAQWGVSHRVRAS